MLKASFKGMYRTKATDTKSSRPMFVYSVSGSKAEIAQFTEAQGENFRADEVSNKPLFFSTRLLSFNKTEQVDLLITGAGKVVADETNKIFTREALIFQAETTLQARINLGLEKPENAVSLTALAKIADPLQTVNTETGEITNAVLVEESGDNPFGDELDEPAA